MIRSSTISQIVRILVASAALAAGAIGCGGGGGGTTGAGGTMGTGAPCDAKPIFALKACATSGVCHDANGAAAAFNMATAGWETKLVGVKPKGGGMMASLCAASGKNYLDPGSAPATGLFLDKLKVPPPCGVVMPNVGTPLNATELACVQSWANALTAVK